MELSPIQKLNAMHEHARTIFGAAINAVNAENAVKHHCRISGNHLIFPPKNFDLSQYEHIYVVGAGKATAQMAAAMEALLGESITSGLITVKYGHTASLKTIQTIEAGHPVPDENGMEGASQILEMVRDAEDNDLVICLLSGGGSALLPLPASPVTLAEKQETIRQFLACGAEIKEINTIRKHLSAIKGGHLARAAHPGELLTLILSDVVGDSLDVIASGPTVPDTSTFADAMEILQKYKLTNTLPATVTERIMQGISGSLPETLKAEDLPKNKNVHAIVGSNLAALNAASDRAAALGYKTLILSSMIEGDTANAARFHAAIAKEIISSGYPLIPPACILSGGETTVQVCGNGLGGRNQEFCLVAAMNIADEENIVILSGGTDGTDGPTDAAGAIVDSDTIANAEAIGLSAKGYLDENNSYHFFQKTQNLLMTGPTGTNVMDVRIILVK